jgi:four helix bundle protein
MKEREYDLEDRLVSFSSNIIELARMLPNTKASNYIRDQMTRCGSSPAMNYGEAQGAESPDDFIHKMKVVLKELKETRVCLKLIIHQRLITNEKFVVDLRNECEELIAITAKSIITATNNNKKNKDRDQ